MIGHWILDEHGEPVEVDLMTWARWREIPSNFVVAKDRVGDAVVSLVFMGIDMRHDDNPNRLPLLWELMVFGGAHDDLQERFSSRADALARHGEIVAALREGRSP